MPFDKQKFFENVQKLIALALKLAPLFLAEDGKPLMQATGPVDAATVEADLVAAFDATPQIAEGHYGGPIIDDQLRKALHALITLATDNVETAIDIFNRVVADRLPPWLNI